MKHLLALALLITTPAFVAGCLLQQLGEVEDAEVAYDRCVVQRGEGDPECRILEERKRQAQFRDEEDAKRRWGCDPQQEECPTKR